MAINNSADTLNASLTFDGAVFTVNSPTIDIGTSSSDTTISGSLTLPSLSMTSTANILYYNAGVISYDAAPSIPAAWLTSGANVGAGLLLGNADTNSWSMQSNSIPFFTVDQFQDVNFTPADYSVTASGGIFLSGATGSSYTDAANLSIDSVAITIGQTLMQTIFIGGLATTSLQGYSGGNIQWEAAGNYSAKSDTGNVQFTANSGQFSADGLTVNLGASTATAFNLGNSACVVTATASNWNVTANGSFIEDSTATFSLGASTATSVILGNAAGSTTIYAMGGGVIAGLQLLSDNIGMDGLDPSSTISIGPANASTITVGNFNTGTATSINADNLSLTGVSQVSIDSNVNVLIGPTNCTNLAFGNAATQSSLVGTQFQISTTVAFVADAPDVQIASSAATIVTFGNTNVTMSVAAQTMSILATSTLDIDCSSVLQFGNADAITIQISNPGATTTFDGTNLNIPNLPSATTSDVIFYNSSSGALSFGAAPSGSSGWLTNGSNTGAGLILGNADTNSWTMQSNSTVFFLIDSAQNLTYAVNSYTMYANAGVTFNANAGLTVNSSAGGFGVSVSDTIVLNGSGAFTSSCLGYTFSPYTGGFIVNGSNTAGGFSVSMPSGSASLYGYNASSYTTATSLLIDSPLLDLGTTASTTLTIGRSASAIVINGSSFTALTVPTDTGTVAVPAHTPPAGYNYLCINTSTGVIAQFSA